MKVRFLGACQEVGRSGIAVKTDDKHVLLDYGVLVDHEIGFPVHVSPKDLEAIVVTHAHLDHSGLLPLFYVRGRIPVYGIEPTFQLSNILIRDMIKLSGYYLPYEYIDLHTMMDHSIKSTYRSEFDAGGARVRLLNAGHIPGSAQVLLESEGSRLLYTGDYNLVPTRLVPAADQDYGHLDAIIMESTYANEDHPERKQAEEDLVAACTDIVGDGGTVLVPAFGVGRSQEVLCILAAHGFRYPVFVDGMALDAINVLERHPDSLRDPDLFKRAMRGAEWIRNWHDRRRAVRTAGVIVSPAGMLKGGAAVFYMESIAKSKKNGIFLVSYQVPGSPGRILLDEGRFMLHGRVRKVDATVGKFDFSSHGGRSQLHETLSKLNRDARVFVIHGDPENCRTLADWTSKEMGLEATVPKPGEVYDV